MTSTEALVQALADRAELADLVARHSLWLDEGQWDATDRLFTEDVAVAAAAGEARGFEALIELARSRHDKYVRTLHNKANLIIDIDADGATATVRAHDTAVFVIDDKTEAVAAAVHRYGARRTGDGWRFDRIEITPVALTTALDRAR